MKVQREEMETHLLQSVTSIPANVGTHGAQFRLLQASGDVPTAGLLDLVRFAWQPQLLMHFNPFLSEASCKSVQAGVLIWLQLCVLEDRLGRLQVLAHGGADYLPMLVQVSHSHFQLDFCASV